MRVGDWVRIRPSTFTYKHTLYPYNGLQGIISREDADHHYPYTVFFPNQRGAPMRECRFADYEIERR